MTAYPKTIVYLDRPVTVFSSVDEELLNTLIKKEAKISKDVWKLEVKEGWVYSFFGTKEKSCLVLWREGRIPNNSDIMY